MGRWTKSAAAAAALILGMAAGGAHAVVVAPGPGPVTATLDLGGPRNVTPGAVSWSGNAFTSGFDIDLGEGDEFDLTIDFLDDQTMTLNDASFMWAISFSGSPTADVRGTGRFAFLDVNGDPILWSNEKTTTESYVHFGQQFNAFDFDGLPSTITFGGVRYLGTLEDYTEAPQPGDIEWTPTYGEDEPFTRTYNSPFLSLAGSSWFASGVPLGEFNGENEGTPLLPNGGTDQGGFVFGDIPVIQEQVVWFDPIVAVGYDFVLGAGSPNILWADFPTLGDPDGFQIYDLNDLFNPIGTVADGGVFDFTLNGYAGGIFGFALRGIDPSLLVDPNSPTAFVTGIAFAANGTVTMTQIPVTEDFGGNPPAVPEPATWATMTIGFGLLGAALRRRRLFATAG